MEGFAAAAGTNGFLAGLAGIKIPEWHAEISRLGRACKCQQMLSMQ
jgi:hypothetical protein